MKIKLISFLLIFCSQITVNGQFNITHDDKSRKLDSLYSELYKYGEFNGNVLIAERDTVILKKSFGLAKRESNQVLNENSIFNLASITKQFTATAIFLLANDGKLFLNDELEKHIPELGFYKGVTINHLIHHTSGLPDYMQLWNEKGEKGKIATNESVIKLYAEEKPELLFEPNQKWEYSNTGYLLLATIIELVSKKNYSDFLKEKFFYPLKMVDTDVLFVYKDSLDLDNLAIGYTEDTIGVYTGYNEFAKSFDGVYGQGRIYSTSSDLYKWAKAIKSNEIISDQDKTTLFSSTQLSSGEKIEYGFGWFLNEHAEYGKIISHSGNWSGYNTYVEQHLDNDLTIILLQNNGNATGKTRIPLENTLKLLYGHSIKPDLRLPDKLLQKYAGTYISENGNETNIILKDKSLWVIMNPSMKFELVPHTENQFIVNGFRPQVTYDFIYDENGETEKFRVQQPEQGIDKISIKKK